MLSNIRITTRISGGFFLILALLSALAFFAYTSTDRLGGFLDRFASGAERSVNATSIRYEVADSRLTGRTYIADPTGDNRADFLRMLDRVENATEAFMSSGMANARQLDTTVENYARNARLYIQSNEARGVATRRVEELGIETRRHIGRMNDVLEARGASDLAYTALRASEALLVTRARVDRFIAGGEISEFNSATTPLQNTQSLLQSLAASALIGEERSLLATAREGVAEFGRAIETAREAELLNRQRLADMDASVPPVETAMDALGQEATTFLTNLSDAGARTVNSTTTTLVVSASVILALGAAAAILLSISISRALNTSVDQTRRLADGDLSVEITGSKHRSELGDLSRALEVFKDNAEETLRLTAAAEAKRTEDDERQKHEMAKQKRVVNDISSGLNRLAAGDLTRHIDSPANDPFPEEYEDLRNAYNGVVDQLAGIVSRIGMVADSVRGGSGEINAASRDLSARAETQAATLEQSAAALNELTESVRSTAQRASSAEKASQDNRAHAETGAHVVREAVNAMKGIEHSSEQITRIIGVIDDIAFQTNLLALNAGVEAARAGEAGRGFAVVASEVRGLAQRASESAREIKTLIRESATQVEAGSELVSRTGESLEEILRRAAEVSGLVGEIAVAASEQAAGLDEINTGVNQLDQVTQQNAAVAEETTAAATSLLQKAEELTHELSGFQTGNGAGRVIPLAPQHAKTASASGSATNWAAAKPAKAAAGGSLWRDF